ncbi:hypothetical protein GCM10010384_25900 [Streptomyces djakartensis]|uniref:Uncharacterized protein n=1 Tax=Streptomyces djakartensis TaxID=68193 RepID=A0ABQ2ZNM2_9ACTN|nr:hypothetical protein GCM10010384_25900 [Streptomyces djakartensis]
MLGGSPNGGIGSAGRFTCDGRELWYSYESPPPKGGPDGPDGPGRPGGWKRPPGPGDVGGGAAGVYEVAVLVRKFHRHSSQNGAPPSRGVRHCGQSSGSAFGTEERCGGRPPG